uniref:Ribosomal RNA-processing protein 43 n=1 Tax=Oryza meridionalis TaxID=40149 RepID=A0A0E0F526_9ORYZ
MAAEAQATAAGGLAGEMEMEAYRRLFPLAFLERHLRESVRPDARRLAEARPTTIALAAVSSAHGSALVRLGDTAMLASIKLEVMSPSSEAPDEGSIAVEFHMPPICSPLVRPGRPAEVAPVISKNLEDILMRDAKFEGALFDQWEGILVSIPVEIPLVSVGDDGRVFTVGGNEGKAKYELVNREKRKLTIANVPFSLTCALHKGNVLADPTAEEESIIETSVTIVLDSSDQIVSIQKPGGAVTSMTTIKECISLAKDGRRKLREILMDSVEAMEVDQTD